MMAMGSFGRMERRVRRTVTDGEHKRDGEPCTMMESEAAKRIAQRESRASEIARTCVGLRTGAAR